MSVLFFRLYIFLFFLVSFPFICWASPQCEINRYITFTELEKSLPSDTITVGFDIDYTVIDVSSSFLGWFMNPDGSIKKADYNPFRDIEFWKYLNSDGLAYSLPKNSAKRLLDIHRKRGDTIYFITSRIKTDDEKLTSFISNIFGIQDVKIYFMGSLTREDNTVEIKADKLSELGVKLYYGDSDSDMKDAKRANARPIRILTRTPYSPHREVRDFAPPRPNRGVVCEEILSHSWY